MDDRKENFPDPRRPEKENMLETDTIQWAEMKEKNQISVPQKNVKHLESKLCTSNFIKEIYTWPMSIKCHKSNQPTNHYKGQGRNLRKLIWEQENWWLFTRLYIWKLK